MRVIAFKMLKDFWESPAAPKGAEQALRTWNKTVEQAAWRNYAELRMDFRSTDKVGDCFVFDIMNNHLRLIAFVRFANDTQSGIVYIRAVMTHQVYDENKWPDECGCHKPRRTKRQGPRPTKGTRAKRKK